MKKRLLAMLLCAAMVLSMAACSSGGAESDKEEKTEGSGGKKEITVLRLGDITKAEPIFAPIMDSYTKNNPDTTVNFEAMAWDEAKTKLKLLGAQSELPEVMFINIINGWDLASSGYLSDLSDLFKGDDSLSADIPQSIIDVATTEDGKMYWIPSATGAFGVWYNKEYFKQAGLDPNSPPKTVEEMISMAKTITEKTGVPGLGWGITATEDFANITESFYSSYTGVDIWSDADKKFTFEDNKEYRKLFAEVLEEFAKITNDYGITQANSIEQNPFGIRTLFRDGEVAMYLDGVWAVKELKEELDKGEGSKFNTGLFPAGPAGSHPILGCDGWAIPEECKDKDEAWKMVQHLMSSENQTRHASEWGLLPILESEKGIDEFSGEYWNALVEQLVTVSARPKDKNVAMIEQAIADGAQAAATRKMTPDEAIDFMIETVHSNYVE